MKKILALILVLVVAAIAVVCTSCAKKEAEDKTEMVSYTVVNNTGKNVTEIAMEDRKGSSKMSAKPEGGGWEDGSFISFSMLAVVENNAPDLMFSFTVEGGNNLSGTVTQKEGTITLVTRDDGIGFDVTAPTK